MRILHVIHRLGSGVDAVVADYASVTKQFEHHLYYSADSSCRVDARQPFATSVEVASEVGRFARGLRARVAELEPDVVHAHSSIAGAIARVCLSKHDRPIVYTPHCFAFERRDVSASSRRAYRTAEWLLSMRTTAIAACSPREATLAKRFRAPVVYVPNVAADIPINSARIVAAKTFVTSGRITAQKSPQLFAEASRRVPGAFEWVGSGDPALTRDLVDAGVTVTGWLDHSDAMARMGRSSVYIHTAEWESAPMTVLEAAAMGLPVVARDTPALREMGCAPLWSSIDQLGKILADEDAIDESRRRSRELTKLHSRPAQAARLAALYTAIADAREPSRAVQGLSQPA
jgi:glycosyltransferase involved in cell wall biosynthesis